MTRVLDFGAGGGGFKRFVELFMHRCHVRAIDKVGSGVVESFEFVPGAIFPGKEYDVVTMLSVVQYIPDLQSLFGSVRRVLRPQGTLVVVYPSLLTMRGKHWWYCDYALWSNGFTMLVKERIGGRFFGYVYIEAVRNDNHANATTRPLNGGRR